MAENKFFARLKQQFGGQIAGANFEAIDPWIQVEPGGLLAVAAYLRDEPDLRFNMLNCITAVDFFEPDSKKAGKVDWQPHLELVYHLSSVSQKHTLVLKVHLPRWQEDQPGELPEISSVSSLWNTAIWHEREVYDLSGVFFVGHPGLHRILLPEDWQGHPLRKDYEMPLEYHGIRGR